MHEGQHGRPGDQPHGGAHQCGETRVAEPQVGVRVDGGNVAVHTDAGHEGDADVDVGEEDRAGDATHGFAKYPIAVVQMVVDTKRQGEQEKRVGHRQVDDVYVWRRFLFDFKDEVVQSSEISYQSKKQDQTVHRCEEVALERQKLFIVVDWGGVFHDVLCSLG